MPSPTLFSRFLSALGVPHTAAYSDSRFRAMPFQSLFGLSHLLKEYGVGNEGLNLSQISEIAKIPTPFLAQTKNGVFVIVTDINPATSLITYDSLGTYETVPLGEFEQACNGNVLLAYPGDASREPSYGAHHLQETVTWFSKWALIAAVAVVFAYFFITRQVYAHISTILVAMFNCVGLYFSYLLLQKSLGIHTAAADRMCGVLQRGGCDEIMKMKVSKLFGVFSWSEVGFGYFGISLVTLLLFPSMWPALALCNVCCLPYTFWSIWYQKFRAHHWCTLCVGVQSTLWLLFFSYLAGGWLRGAFPLGIHFFILIAVYVTAVLGINLMLRVARNLPCHEENQ